MFTASFLIHSFLKGVKKGNQNLRFKVWISAPPPIVSVKSNIECFTWEPTRFPLFVRIYCVCEVKAAGSESIKREYFFYQVFPAALHCGDDVTHSSSCVVAQTGKGRGFCSVPLPPCKVHQHGRLLTSITFLSPMWTEGACFRNKCYSQLSLGICYRAFSPTCSRWSAAGASRRPGSSHPGAPFLWRLSGAESPATTRWPSPNWDESKRLLRSIRWRWSCWRRDTRSTSWSWGRFGAFNYECNRMCLI